MNYCPNCGTANRDGSRFCNECGRKLPSKTGIICPMCSHVNPAANVYCDNCQARLVPLTPASQPTPPPGPQAAPGGGTSQFKKGLSLPTKPADESAQPETEPSGPEPDETPDWLVKLRAAAPKASEMKPKPPEPTEPEPAAGSLPPPAEIPDWMRPTEGEAPDWFRRITESAPAVQPVESAPQPSEDDLPDWMRDLDLASPGQPVLRSPRPKGVGGAVEGPAPPALPAEGGSVADEADWLEQLRSEPAASDRSGEDLDWLSARETPPSVETEPAPSQDTAPDWLAGLQTPSEVEAPAPAGEAPVGELDWLAEIRGPSQVETPPEELTAEEPAWLADTKVRSSLQAQPGVSETETAADTKVRSSERDWLSRITGSTDLPAEKPAVEGAPSAPSAGPEWLGGVGSEALSTEMAPGSEQAPDTGEAPDWLRDVGIGQPAQAEKEDATTIVSGPVAAFVGEEVEPVEQGEAPSWLTDVGQLPAPAETQVSQPAELPDWLRDLGPLPKAPTQPEEIPFGEVPPAEPGQVPDWLQAMQPGRAAPTFADEAGRPLDTTFDRSAVDSTGLAAAAIPSWLQSLRPTEAPSAPAAGVEESVVESEGVLAGLRNVLPASPFMGTPQGAPAVTRAQIPTADLARAGLFQELLARGSLAPTLVRPGLGRKFRMGDRISRWIIAALIIILAFTPNVSNIAQSFFQLDAVDASLYRPAQEQIEALTAGDRVLIVFDYDAFQAGEMDTIAEAFLTHVRMKDADVSVTSLNPLGLSIAHRLLPDIPCLNQNQCYLPGQAAGVQSALASSRAKLIIVLAGSPEPMRWWIEQAATSGAQTPIVAGLSAGALPQVLPYVQSGQVKAAVTGLIGGLAYRRSLDPEPDAGDDGLDRMVRSEALYLSQIAFAVILIAGVFVSLLTRTGRAN
ncbi:MAG: double zinc ribbon domain-containing protein [Anaerolineae bacterium]